MKFQWDYEKRVEELQAEVDLLEKRDEESQWMFSRLTDLLDKAAVISRLSYEECRAAMENERRGRVDG